MNNTIRIAKDQHETFKLEAAFMGIQYINLGDVGEDTRVMIDSDDLLDAYSLGYVMGVNAMTDNIKKNLKL